MPKKSFCEILKASIERETTNRGWCGTCRKYQTLQTKKTIHTSPPVLMLNANLTSPESKQFWETPGCLPEEIGTIINMGQIYCYQGEDLRLHIARGAHNITVYSLVGFAAEIDVGQNEKPHLVSLVNGETNILFLHLHVLTYHSCSFCANSTSRKSMASL